LPGDIFVVSGPSGSGKTSICTRLLSRVRDLRLTVSYTTRRMKNGEVHGKDYYFVNDAEFDKIINLGGFLEYANVYGNRYGTARHVIDEILSSGEDGLLEIDVQGGMKVKAAIPEAILVAVFPPSWAMLRKRLQDRGRDTGEEIASRLLAASREIEVLLSYDYLVVNDELDEAVSRVESIVRATRLRRERMLARMERIIKETREAEDGTSNG
jgi:guanylate kinase